MPSNISDGSLTPSDNTEQTLVTDTSNRNFVLAVDLANMAGGTTPDIVVLRLKTKVRSGGTSRQAYIAQFVGVQADPNVYSVPVPANIEVVATLTQTQGTLRSFPWALLAL